MMFVGISAAVAAKYPKDCVYLISGVCFDCETPYTLKMSNKDSCLKNCPHRIYNEKTETCEFRDILAAKVYDDFYDEKPEEDKRACKGDGYFLNVYKNKCFSCEIKEPIWVDPNCSISEKCKNSCPNRIIKYAFRNITRMEAASVLKCPADRPLMDKYYACWSCDEPATLNLGYEIPRFKIESHINETLEKYAQLCGDKREFILEYKLRSKPVSDKMKSDNISEPPEVISYYCPEESIDAEGIVKCRRCGYNGRLRRDTPECAKKAAEEEKAMAIEPLKESQGLQKLSNQVNKVIKVQSGNKY